MSSSRVTVSGALLVCSVLSTRWPVSEASMAMLRGFLVADLADHDDVGVGAQEGAQRLGEGPVDLRVDLHLAQPGLGDFHRVLGGPDLALGRVDVPSAECSVVVLPEPVGPTHSTMP
jgi:hypothetical protein